MTLNANGCAPVRVGIFGGSFNPIHNGHVALGRELVTNGEVDELWYVVSPHNPLKQHDELMDDALRLELVRRALRDDERLKACDIEFRLPRPSYMVDTLAALRKAQPDKEFVLVIGADNWLCFKRWRQWEEILRHHRLLVYRRPGYELKDTGDPRATIAETSLHDISSTEIRALMQQPNYKGDGLPEGVWGLIKNRE